MKTKGAPSIFAWRKHEACPGRGLRGVGAAADDGPGAAPPYAGEQAREVKALSAEKVKQYLSGAGMGYAKAAELNGFPGPSHVLELVESERALDALFRSGAVGREALPEAVRSAAALEGEYRLSHLEAHRRTRAILTSDQVARYDEFRGYGTPAQDGAHRH